MTFELRITTFQFRLSTFNFQLSNFQFRLSNFDFPISTFKFRLSNFIYHTHMIKVLIVDDSKVVQEFMNYLLSSDPDIQVVGIAGSGDAAIVQVREKRPDVITMDIHMPGMDGYEATRIIMETLPTPIVIVSSTLSLNEVAYTFKLIEVGALSVVLRPPHLYDPGFESAHKMLIQTIKLMSEVKVVKRFPKQMSPKLPPSLNRRPEGSSGRDIQLIAIGASTGGPLALQKILSILPGDLPVPVLIVQHIASGFLGEFKDWLSVNSKLPLKIGKDNELLKPGTVYIAPDTFQFGVSHGSRIKLYKPPGENGLCPSVDYLFRTVAEVFGPKAIGVLLTGMGKDGAKELWNNIGNRTCRSR